MPYEFTAPAKKETQLEKVIGNAELILGSQKKEPIDEYSFTDETQAGYRRTDIAADMKEVARLKKIFADQASQLPPEIRERRKISDAVEVILTEKAEEMHWFGENAAVDKTGPYDDFCNHIDSVLTISMPGENAHRIALAIDVSMRASLSEEAKKNGKDNSVQGKIARNILKVTDPQRRAEVKYFKSSLPGDNYKGKLTGIVPVVVGLEGENAQKLITLFGEITALQKNTTRTAAEEETLRRKIQEARDHPCQAIFFLEIRAQLKMYSIILKKEGGIKGQFFAAEVDQLIPVIDSIIAAKKDISCKNLKNDKVFNVIREVVKAKSGYSEEI